MKEGSASFQLEDLESLKKDRFFFSNIFSNNLIQSADDKSNKSVEDMDRTFAGW